MYLVLYLLCIWKSFFIWLYSLYGQIISGRIQSLLKKYSSFLVKRSFSLPQELPILIRNSAFSKVKGSDFICRRWSYGGTSKQSVTVIQWRSAVAACNGVHIWQRLYCRLPESGSPARSYQQEICRKVVLSAYREQLYHCHQTGINASGRDGLHKDNADPEAGACPCRWHPRSCRTGAKDFRNHALYHHPPRRYGRYHIEQKYTSGLGTGKNKDDLWVSEKSETLGRIRWIRAEALRTDGNFQTATDFYLAHRDEMDKGAVVSWESRYNHAEVSALQQAMNLKLRFRNFPHAR